MDDFLDACADSDVPQFRPRPAPIVDEVPDEMNIVVEAVDADNLADAAALRLTLTGPREEIEMVFMMLDSLFCGQIADKISRGEYIGSKDGEEVP